MLKTHQVGGIINCIIRTAGEMKSNSWNVIVIVHKRRWTFKSISSDLFLCCWASRCICHFTVYVAQWQREADLVGHQNIYNSLRLQFNNLPVAKAAASHACFGSLQHGRSDGREQREQNRTLSEGDTVLRYSCVITAAFKCFYTFYTWGIKLDLCLESINNRRLRFLNCSWHHLLSSVVLRSLPSNALGGSNGPGLVAANEPSSSPRQPIWDDRKMGNDSCRGCHDSRILLLVGRGGGCSWGGKEGKAVLLCFLSHFLNMYTLRQVRIFHKHTPTNIHKPTHTRVRSVPNVRTVYCNVI